MNDMSSVIIPKSDQINADDLIAGPMTITIRDVQIKGGQEQPVSIYFDGSDKAFRPCKSMSRVLVQAWGADAKAYIGRSVTLYRDPEVKWGGLAVGGIRISHMSDIDGPKQMMLTATKGSRKPHKVLPLVMQQRPTSTAQDDPATKWANGYIAKLAEFTTPDALQAFAVQKAAKLSELESARPDLHERVTAALATRTADLKPAASSFDDDDDFGLPKLPADQASAEGNAPASGDTVQSSDAAASTANGETTSDSGPTATTDASPSDDNPHPAQAIADKIIAEINDPATNAVMDVAAILNREALDISAMPDELAVKIEIAADKKRNAIRAAQAKAKAKENEAAE